MEFPPRMEEVCVNCDRSDDGVRVRCYLAMLTICSFSIRSDFFGDKWKNEDTNWKIINVAVTTTNCVNCFLLFFFVIFFLALLINAICQREVRGIEFIRIVRGILLLLSYGIGKYRNLRTAGCAWFWLFEIEEGIWRWTDGKLWFVLDIFCGNLNRTVRMRSNIRSIVVL